MVITKVMKQPEEILIGDNSLFNTIVNEIKIFVDESGILNVLIKFTNFSKKSNYSSLEILFINVKEYSFYHNNRYNFYNVENYKFFKVNQDYYLCLDPDDTTDLLSENDMDYIISSKLLLKGNNKDGNG